MSVDPAEAQIPPPPIIPRFHNPWTGTSIVTHPFYIPHRGYVYICREYMDVPSRSNPFGLPPSMGPIATGPAYGYGAFPGNNGPRRELLVGPHDELRESVAVYPIDGAAAVTNEEESDDEYSDSGPREDDDSSVPPAPGGQTNQGTIVNPRPPQPQPGEVPAHLRRLITRFSQIQEYEDNSNNEDGGYSDSDEESTEEAVGAEHAVNRQDPESNSSKYELGVAVIQSSASILAEYDCQRREAAAADSQSAAGPSRAADTRVVDAEPDDTEEDEDEDAAVSYPHTHINFKSLKDSILEANLNKSGRTAKPAVASTHQRPNKRRMQRKKTVEKPRREGGRKSARIAANSALSVAEATADLPGDVDNVQRADESFVGPPSVAEEEEEEEEVSGVHFAADHVVSDPLPAPPQDLLQENLAPASLSNEDSAEAADAQPPQASPPPAPTTRSGRKVNVRTGPRMPDEYITAASTKTKKDKGKGKAVETNTAGKAAPDATEPSVPVAVDLSFKVKSRKGRRRQSSKVKLDHALMDDKIRSNQVPPHSSKNRDSSRVTITIRARPAVPAPSTSKGAKRRRAVHDKAEVVANTEARPAKKAKRAPGHTSFVPPHIFESNFETMPLVDPTSFQDDIDRDISILKAKIRDLKTRRNEFSFIGQLPDEVLSTIFILMRDDALSSPSPAGKLTWLNISPVCRHWRQLSLATPALWSYIDFTNLDCAKAMMQRSKAVPLSVKITLAGDSSGDRLWELASDAISSMPLREIDIETPEYGEMLQLLEQRQFRPAPSLQSLKLTCLTIEEVYDLVEWSWYGVPSLDPQDQSSRAVLSRGDSGHASIYPRIEELSLASLHGDPYGPPPEVVNLPYLRSLELRAHDERVARIFGYLSFPPCASSLLSFRRHSAPPLSKTSELPQIVKLWSRFVQDLTSSSTSPPPELVAKLTMDHAKGTFVLAIFQGNAPSGTEEEKPCLELEYPLPEDDSIIELIRTVSSRVRWLSIFYVKITDTWHDFLLHFQEIHTLTLNKCHLSIIHILIPSPWDRGHMLFPSLNTLILANYEVKDGAFMCGYPTPEGHLGLILGLCKLRVIQDVRVVQTTMTNTVKKEFRSHGVRVQWLGCQTVKTDGDDASETSSDSDDSDSDGHNMLNSSKHGSYDSDDYISSTDEEDDEDEDYDDDDESD
ncbi:hypothetical protein ONZ45_g1081 [Pleurotus djamor]|nr:hypothetical protein ONZ45_g1081 [Pleurotus djamor]